MHPKKRQRVSPESRHDGEKDKRPVTSLFGSTMMVGGLSRAFRLFKVPILIYDALRRECHLHQKVSHSSGLEKYSYEILLVLNVVVSPNHSILTRSFLAGDIAYADYWLKEEIQGFLPNMTIADGVHVYESLLKQFYDEMTPLTSQKAYMVGPGNHEANCKC